MSALFSGGERKVEHVVLRKPAPPPPPAPVVVAKAPESRVFLVEILNGNKRTEEKFSRSANESKP